MDDFKLPHDDWDVLVHGTGVKPSLLAVALARANLRVLQIDPNPYYGGYESAFTIDELENWAAGAPSTFHPNDTAGFAASRFEKRATIDRPRTYALSLAPHLVYWGCSLLELLRDVGMTTSFTWQAVGSWWIYLPDEALCKPAAGSGGFGAALVSAGVKAVKVGGTIRKKGTGWNKGRTRSAGTMDEMLARNSTEVQHKQQEQPEEGTALRKLGGAMREVPCTFEDVAWSHDLKDKDRGCLGGFLRFVMKCKDPDDAKHRKILEDHGNSSLTDFLSTVYPLPPFSIASIHSLTLLPTSPQETALKDAVDRLATHISALGRIPDIRSAAALTIAYGGSADLCQVWSRGAAVAGGVNILDRGITKFSRREDGKLSVELTNGEVITSTWVITDDENKSISEPGKLERKEGGDIKKSIQLAKGIYVVSSSLSSIFAKKSENDRVAPNVVVLTFPAGSLEENPAPLYVVARSSGTGECCVGETVLHTSMLADGDGHEADAAYKISDKAIEKVLKVCGEEGEVKVTCRYLQRFPAQSLANPPTERGREVGGTNFQQTTNAGLYGSDNTQMPSGARVVLIKTMSDDLAFPDDVVEQCRNVYEEVVGTTKGFLTLNGEAAVRGSEEEGE